MDDQPPITRYLAPDIDPARREEVRLGGAKVAPLARRGAFLGWLVEPHRPVQPEPLDPLWTADRPIHLPQVLNAGIEAFADEIADSREMFEALADDGGFAEAIAARMEHQDFFIPQGSSVDQTSEREIERVWLAALEPRTEEEARMHDVILADELWIKLSWIADDPADRSLRVRFSSGVEQLGEWMTDAARAPFCEALAEAVFPECATISEHVPLVEAIAELIGKPVRLSERIIYANAPDGGAVFHHDGDPGQQGVVFGQFAGETVWFALPKRELAALLEDHSPQLAADDSATGWGLRALDRAGDDRAVYDVLNRDPSFAEALIEAGHAYRLRTGDALLLPNHGHDDTCWHSVFALGHSASLAHSYGIFVTEEPEGAGNEGPSESPQ